MKNIKNIIVIVVIAIVALVMMDGVYVVSENEQVIVTQFGKPVSNAVQKAGMHFKIPFIQTAHYFDSRYLEWDGDPNQIPTKDKKFIFVDTYARWRISDPLQFYKRMGTERSAQSRLDDILDGETRDAIASHDLVELVRSTNREPASEGAIVDIVQDTLENIQVGRDSIQVQIQRAGKRRATELGIEVMDFRIKRVNYVEDVRQQVYGRMRSERNRIADKFISEGNGEASRINGQKERELREIRSEAYRKAQEIRGKADARAANIYAQAYNQSRQARDFYEFMKSMETLEKTFDGKTSIILSTNSELYKYLNNME